MSFSPRPPGGSRRSFRALFHGGMWVGKSLGDFVPWALHLAQQGIAGIIPMFRTRGDYEVEPMDILEEGREAWAWLHGNAALLGLDPARITVAGSDAGGLMALHVALPDHPARWSLFRKRLPFLPAPPPWPCSEACAT